MTSLSKDPIVRAMQQRLATLPGVTLPDATNAAHRADARTLDREDAAHAADVVTVRRTALPYYAADALQPVTIADEPHPFDSQDQTTDAPTRDDLVRQRNDVEAMLDIMRSKARTRNRAGISLSAEALVALDDQVRAYKRLRGKLDDQIAAMDAGITTTGARVA